MLKALRRGARQEYGGFESRGAMNAGVPQGVQSVGRLEKILRANVYYQFQDGNTETASKDLASLYSMSQHITDAATVSASSQAMGMTRLSNEATAWAMDRGAIEAEDAAVIEDAIEAFREHDPLNHLGAFASETARLQDWLTDSFERGAYGEIQRYVEAFGADGVVDVSSMSEEEFRDGVEYALTTVDRIVEASLIDDPEEAQERVNEIVTEFKASDYSFMVPWIDNVGLSVGLLRSSRSTVGTDAERLRALVIGDVAPGADLNAAVAYLRVIDELRAMPGMARRVEMLFADDRHGSAADRSRALLVELSEELAAVEEASRLRRCDFASARREETIAHMAVPVHEYMPWMQVLIRAFEVRSRVGQDVDLMRAADDVACALRIINHLAGDGPALSAVVAHHEFTNVVHGRIHGEASWRVEARDAMREALGRFQIEDPFGYARVAVKTRRVLQRYLGVEPERAYSDCDVSTLWLLSLYVNARLYHELDERPGWAPILPQFIDLPLKPDDVR